MTETEREATSPPNIPPFYRRTYLVYPKAQLSIILKVAGLVGFLLLILNIALVGFSSSATRKIISANPDLAPIMAASDRGGTYLMAAISVFLLLLVVLRTVVLTHRTSGAAFNIRRCLGRVTEGDLTIALKLRPKDNLRELQDPFNEMVDSLRKRASEEQKLLTDLASTIEGYGHPDEAKILRDLADSKEYSQT